MSDIDDCLESVERLTRDRGEVMRAGNDKKLAERLARVQFGGNSWRASNEQFRLSVELIWIEHIKTIRRAGLELVEREDKP